MGTLLTIVVLTFALMLYAIWIFNRDDDDWGGGV